MEGVGQLPIFDAAHFLTMSGSPGIIGKGGYGQIRLCQNLQSKRVAVKYFAVTGSRDQMEEKLKKIKNEGEILYKLSHPNIMKVFGITEWNNFVGIVTEYMPNGNLDGFLNNKKLQDIPWTIRLRMAVQIAEAIKYLHHYKLKKELIHGDIKPDNILLDENLTIKLADFGSVNLKQHSGASTTITKIPMNKQHTLFYTSPEFLKEPTKLRTTYMDIYSFGIVLYEFVTRCRPYENATVHLHVLLDAIMYREQRPDQSSFDVIQSSLSANDVTIFKLFIEQMRKCWSQQPSDRPEMQSVCDSLRRTMDELNENTVEQQARNIVEALGRKEMEFDIKQIVSLNSISFESDNVANSRPTLTDNTLSSLDKSSPSASPAVVSNSPNQFENENFQRMWDDGSQEEMMITDQKKQELLHKIKKKPIGSDLIEICKDVMELADDDFTSEVASYFPSEASFHGTPLSIEDVRAISFVMKKVNKKIEWLSLSDCNLTSEKFEFLLQVFKETRGSVDGLNIGSNLLSSNDLDGIYVIMEKVNARLWLVNCFDDGKGGRRNADKTERFKLQEKLRSIENSNLQIKVDWETILRKTAATKKCSIC